MLTPTRAIERPQPVAPPRRRPPPRSPGLGERVRRIALIAAALCAIPVAVSYIQAITARSDSSLGIRTVEWLRDNGARGLVNKVESIYYSLNAPAKGGPALRALPGQP